MALSCRAIISFQFWNSYFFFLLGLLTYHFHLIEYKTVRIKTKIAGCWMDRLTKFKSKFIRWNLCGQPLSRPWWTFRIYWLQLAIFSLSIFFLADVIASKAYEKKLSLRSRKTVQDVEFMLLGKERLIRVEIQCQ